MATIQGMEDSHIASVAAPADPTVANTPDPSEFEELDVADTDDMDEEDAEEADQSDDQVAAEKANASPSEAHDQPTMQSIDPRHLRRIKLMQGLFAYVFHEQQGMGEEFLRRHGDIAEIIADVADLDKEIQVAAPERPLSQINKVDLAILRLIMFEWKKSHTPKKVLINEGVELAKEFGTESSPKFVNGVLAQLLM